MYESTCKLVDSLLVLVTAALNSQAERLKSSAARPVAKLEAVVLNGLLADHE